MQTELAYSPTLNYDQTEHWYHEADVSAASIGSGKLNLTMAATAKSDHSQYIETSIIGSRSTDPLHFTPKTGDVIQIRYSLLSYDGAANSGKTASITIYGWDSGKGGTNYLGTSWGTVDTGKVGTYVTKTWTIPAGWTEYDVTRLRITLRGLLNSRVAVDYLYVGSGCTAPEAVHSYTTHVTAPTCTAQGYTTHTCSRCSNSYKDTYVAAKGHTEAIDRAVAATCTTAGKTEGKHCSVCSAILVAQQTIPATGHSYIYTKINALVHSITCKNCDYSVEAPHGYTNGLCICGEPEIKEPLEDSKLKLGHTLNLASDISVNFVIHKMNLESFDLSTVYVESILETYKGNEKTGTTTVRLEPVVNGDYYYFTLTGLTAVQMNDRIISTLYGVKEGQPYCSAADSYSIADYAYSQLGKETMSHSLKTLCAELLRYGGRAQIFKNYRTDALADNNMTENHRAYLTDLDTVTFGNTNTVLNDSENAPVEWFGKSLNLESKVMLRFVFRSMTYEGDLSHLTARITYRDIGGENKTLTLSDPEEYNGTLGLYSFSFDGLLAAELRSVLSVQIFDGEIPVSPTLQYSADTYGRNKTGTLLDLCKALFAYCDSAYSYFR